MPNNVQDYWGSVDRTMDRLGPFGSLLNPMVKGFIEAPFWGVIQLVGNCLTPAPKPIPRASRCHKEKANSFQVKHQEK